MLEADINVVHALKHLIPPIMITFNLNRNKALAAVAYLLDHSKGDTSYFKLLKLIFFADRYHVRKYLRPVTGDQYFAMHAGPVASYLYDVFKRKSPGEGIVRRVSSDSYTIRRGIKDYDADLLSPSDIEALNFALDKFGRIHATSLSVIVHEYPEWAKYAERFARDQKGREPMFFEDFFQDPNSSSVAFKRLRFRDPFAKLSEDDKRILLDELSRSTARLV